MNNSCFTKSEVGVVRKLAESVAVIAASGENARIIRRWQDVNALRRPDRAPVWCRPVACWEELIPQSSLMCSDPWLRKFEYQFRQILCKHQIADDSPLLSYYPVQVEYDVVPANRWGVETGKHRPDAKGGAWGYNPPLKTEEDFEKLVKPLFVLNKAKTEQELEKTENLLKGILPVCLELSPSFGIGTLGSAAADLRGLEQIMMDMAVDPKLVHRLMAYLRDATLAQLETIEQDACFVPNTHEPMLFSDPIGMPQGQKFTLKNCWCAANSQEFDQVSPAMWEEFCLDYQRPIFARFGYVCYGCCENLTHKIDGVLSIPNLRIFVCSAWTDLDTVLNKIDKNYCIMWRQKASDVVFAENTKSLHRDLEEGLRKLQGQFYQVVLRELQTLNGNLDRLHAWTQIAKELAAKYS